MTNHLGKKVTIFAAFFSIVLGTQAQDNVVTLSTTISGNQEQPKVLYIVPWKPVGSAELEDQTIESQLDIVFGHVERVELRRELKYTEKLEKSAKKIKASTK
jgi:hypothetical protein